MRCLRDVFEVRRGRGVAATCRHVHLVWRRSRYVAARGVVAVGTGNIHWLGRVRVRRFALVRRDRNIHVAPRDGAATRPRRRPRQNAAERFDDLAGSPRPWRWTPWSLGARAATAIPARICCIGLLLVTRASRPWPRPRRPPPRARRSRRYPNCQTASTARASRRRGAVPRMRRTCVLPGPRGGAALLLAGPSPPA